MACIQNICDFILFVNTILLRIFDSESWGCRHESEEMPVALLHYVYKE